MAYEFKGNKGEWYAVEYAGFIDMQLTPYYAPDHLLSADSVGEEHMRANGKLMAASQELLNGCIESLELISQLNRHSEPITYNEYSHIHDVLTSAIHKALNIQDDQQP